MSEPSVRERIPALRVDDLAVHFGPVRAVDGVSLRVDHGEVLALVGESGSGKSTVGRAATRLEDPTSGTVELDGRNIAGLRGRRLREARHGVAMVFQDPAGSLDPRMLVGDLIAEPLDLMGRRGRRGRREKVAEQLRAVGLRPEVADRYPHELSGGQRQRIALARALVKDPALLVADEPTSALDVSVQASVLNLFADLQASMGFASLFITHDLAAVEFLADRVAVMYLGKIVETGPRAEIFANPRHPYTQALLGAAPVADPRVQRSRERITLGDDMPTAVDPPSGCRFHTRCPLAIDRCATEVPAARRFAGVDVECHLVDDDGRAPDVRTGNQPAQRGAAA
ncbi:peptide ABC transporter ATP-binding protein [Kytococcus sp. CUA-901]|nr:peptide ABC transporter ATP-binding protein [Kytococcus sp. CUA-901]